MRFAKPKIFIFWLFIENDYHFLFYKTVMVLPNQKKKKISVVCFILFNPPVCPLKKHTHMFLGELVIHRMIVCGKLNALKAAGESRVCCFWPRELRMFFCQKPVKAVTCSLPATLLSIMIMLLEASEDTSYCIPSYLRIAFNCGAFWLSI